MNKYIKNIKGQFEILANDNIQGDELRSVNSQNSLIFKELMKGRKLNLTDVMKPPIYSSKLGTRMSDIRAALKTYGIKDKHDSKKGVRNADYFTYFLDKEDIIKIEAII